MAGLLDFLGGGSGGDSSDSGSGSSGSNGGLMNLYADPQKAALLGFFNGLIQASGPSRVPVNLAQVVGGGSQGATQGFGNALGMQRQLMQMRAMQGLMGGSQSQQAPAQPAAQSDGSAGLMGASAGMGMPGAPNAAAPMPAQQSPAPQSAGPTIMGRTPQQLWNQGLMMNMAGIQGGAEMMQEALKYDPTLAAQMPTDITKMGTQAGMTPQQIQAANASGVTKANYIAPTSGRPGGYLKDPTTGQLTWLPNVPQGAVPQFDGNGQFTGVSPMAGAAAVAQSQAQAKAAGEGSVLPYAGVDANGNPLPVTNRTNAATQGGSTLPLPLRNNNPGAVSPGGSVAQYPDLQTGLAKMDSNLASYAGKPDAGTLGQVITKWVGSPDNAPAYISDVSSRLGIPANTPVDLTNPAQRQAIGTAIMLHENGPSAVFGGSGGGQATTQAQPQGQTQAPSGAIYAAPPMGAQTFAQGAVQQMQNRFGTLRDQNSSAQTVISQLQNIAQLAPNAITGAEADRREYANGLLSLIGVPGAQDAKTSTDLLNKYSNQIIAKLGQGGLGTDAARSIVSAGNPNAHMTVPAIQEAVRNLSSQYQLTQAKTQLLQPFANSNNPSGYTSAETAFDKNADPRIWEWRSIQDPAARSQFAAGILKQDAKFGQKIQALEQMGALQ